MPPLAFEDDDEMIITLGRKDERIRLTVCVTRARTPSESKRRRKLLEMAAESPADSVYVGSQIQSSSTDKLVSTPILESNFAFICLS